jgi:hypothetical protein
LNDTSKETTMASKILSVAMVAGLVTAGRAVCLEPSQIDLGSLAVVYLAAVLAVGMVALAAGAIGDEAEAR